MQDLGMQCNALFGVCASVTHNSNHVELRCEQFNILHVFCMYGIT